MKKLLILLSILILNSCAEKKESISESYDEKFDKFSSEFIEEFWLHNPEYASSVGFHKYDSLLTIVSKDWIKNEISFYENQKNLTKDFYGKNLSQSNSADLEIIKNQIDLQLFYLNEYKSYSWNPSGYNLSGTIAEMLAGKFAPLEKRLVSINQKISKAKEYYSSAKSLIENPTKEHTELAIQQCEGSLSTFDADLTDSIKKSSLTEDQKKVFLDNVSIASAEQKNYIQFLKGIDLKNAKSFRLDKNLYLKKFDLEMQSGYDAKTIYEKALARKQELHKEMFLLSDKLWSKYLKSKPKPKDSLLLVRNVIEELSKVHCKTEEFQVTIEKQIPELEKFITAKNLIDLDSTKPLVVRKEPEYMKGVAGASISSPGPYDKNGNTYYNVGSLASYTKEAAESYLREYNDYTLQILNIHEAIPGHYTQLVYANQSPSLIKAIFGNNPMIEGWAVYGERMMLENGYPNLNGPSTDEMWLMYYKWHLRSVCNTILDYSIHINNITKEQGLDLLQRQAFQQNAEAENKWRRATLTSVQLCSYFTGYAEIFELREECKKRDGEKFDLKKWHNQFLSYGSAPVKIIRKFMLE
jgi:predicted DNA-binding protein